MRPSKIAMKLSHSVSRSTSLSMLYFALMPCRLANRSDSSNAAAQRSALYAKHFRPAWRIKSTAKKRTRPLAWFFFNGCCRAMLLQSARPEYGGAWAARTPDHLIKSRTNYRQITNFINFIVGSSVASITTMHNKAKLFPAIIRQRSH